jgi:transcriptional regulator with XRE-family HTH domain
MKLEPKLSTTTFGQTFRRLRHEAGMTLAQVASAMGWSIVYVSDLERGRRSIPKMAVTDRMLEAVGRSDMANQMAVLAARERGGVAIALRGQGPEVIAMLIAVRQAAKERRLTPRIARKVMRILRENEAKARI